MTLGKPFPRSFFLQPTPEVARKLLGSLLVMESPEGRVSGIIIETEAYLGTSDPASHAFRGLTKRNAAMFAEPGCAYIYFIYGNHFCLNVTTQEPGIGEAVLIRAILPQEGLEIIRNRRGSKVSEKNLTNGPGKLCQAFGIGPELYGHDFSLPPLQMHQSEPDTLTKLGLSVSITPRIGIAKAADWPLRFLAS